MSAANLATTNDQTITTLEPASNCISDEKLGHMRDKQLFFIFVPAVTAMVAFMVFGSLFFSALSIVGGVVGLYFTRRSVFKEQALLKARQWSDLTAQEDADLVELVNQYVKFPRGQYIKIKSSYNLYEANRKGEPLRFGSTTDAGSTTHTQESGLVFKPSGVYWKITTTPNENKIWDDALTTMRSLHSL